MFARFKAIQETIKLIRLANRMSDELPGDTPKFGYLLTNRSFLVPAIGLIVNILIFLNFPLLAPVLQYLQAYSPEITAETIIMMVGMVSIFWSMVERMMTKARAILTPKQAEKALAEVVGDDALAEALREAIN